MIGAISPRKAYGRPFPLSILKKNQKIENFFLDAGGNSFHDCPEHKMLPGDELVSIPQGVSAHG